jgi:hypothetical protein
MHKSHVTFPNGHLAYCIAAQRSNRNCIATQKNCPSIRSSLNVFPSGRHLGVILALAPVAGCRAFQCPAVVFRAFSARSYDGPVLPVPTNFQVGRSVEGVSRGLNQPVLRSDRRAAPPARKFRTAERAFRVEVLLSS